MRSGDAVRDENENDQAEKQKHDLRAEQERGLVVAPFGGAEKLGNGGKQIAP